MKPIEELDRIIVRHEAMKLYYQNKRIAILLKNGLKPPQYPRGK